MFHHQKQNETSERSFLEKEKPLFSKKNETPDASYFLSRFPLEKTKLAYETTIHNKTTMDTEYDIGFAIPFGKRAYLWHTYSPTHTSIAMILELNRENQLGDIFLLEEEDKSPLSTTTNLPLGTIVSGILYEESGQETTLLSNIEKVFIVDDIHMYRGEMISRKPFYEKTGYLLDFLRSQHYRFSIRFPVFWPSSINLSEIPSIPYHYRHIQYRATRKILPHLNFIATKTPATTRNINTNPEIKPVNYKWNWKFDYSKPIYRKTALFYVRADTMFDVYFLGARMETSSDKTNIVYCQHALILNYKTSVFMNGIFRNIRENENIDAIEDSDDESDFENIQENKYVDLEKEVLMECSFHYKFKKWMPFRIVTLSSSSVLEKDDKKVVSIFNL